MFDILGSYIGENEGAPPFGEHRPPTGVNLNTFGVALAPPPPPMVLSAPAIIEGCQSMKRSGSIRWINNPVQSLELYWFCDIKTRKKIAPAAQKNELENELGDCFTYIKPKFSVKIHQYLP